MSHHLIFLQKYLFLNNTLIPNLIFRLGSRSKSVSTPPSKTKEEKDPVVEVEKEDDILANLESLLAEKAKALENMPLGMCVCET